MFQLQLNEDVDKLAIGAEVSQSGYKHWQGAVTFRIEKSAIQVRNLICHCVHLEVMRGSTQAALKYCVKDGQVMFQKNLQLFEEKTSKTKSQEAKNDRARQIINDAENLDVEQFKNKWPMEWLTKRTTIERMMVDAMARRATIWSGKLQNKNFWIWGAPGVGKSAWAAKQAPHFNSFRKNVNKWWCGYHIAYTKLVIIEDYPCFPQGDYLQHHMKVWGDRYPFSGEVKNGQTIVEPGRIAIVITSNYPIEKCFSHPEDIEAIQRRYQEIQMTKANAPLINALQIEWSQLTTRNPELLEEIESTEEQLEDMERARMERARMEQESQEREAMGLDKEEEEW
jgi:hypothetical protein